MADLNRDSDTGTEDDYDDEVGDSCDEEDDSEYDYTGEESNIEDTERERCGFDWQDEALERLSTSEGKQAFWKTFIKDPFAKLHKYVNVIISDGSHVDWEYCEREQEHVLLSRRMAGAPQVYAPERGPPLLDFLFVLTAFFAAIFAAFYTILSETGVHKK